MLGGPRSCPILHVHPLVLLQGVQDIGGSWHERLNVRFLSLALGIDDEALVSLLHLRHDHVPRTQNPLVLVQLHQLLAWLILVRLFDEACLAGVEYLLDDLHLLFGLVKANVDHRLLGWRLFGMRTEILLKERWLLRLLFWRDSAYVVAFESGLVGQNVSNGSFELLLRLDLLAPCHRLKR